MCAELSQGNGQDARARAQVERPGWRPVCGAERFERFETPLGSGMVASAKGHARVDDDPQPVRVRRKRFPGGKQEEPFAHLDRGKVLTPAFIPGVPRHLDKRGNGVA